MSSVYENSFHPSRFLVENIKLLPAGHVLDIAMGYGRNAIFLAKSGFIVEGVDRSPEAVRASLKAAKQAGVSITAKIADLESDYHIKKSFYSVIICFNYLQRSLISQIKEGLIPGGIVVYETFTIDQSQFWHPNNPDYLLKYNELLDMFRDFRCLRYREGIIDERKAVASIVAQKYQ